MSTLHGNHADILKKETDLTEQLVGKSLATQFIAKFIVGKNPANFNIHQENNLGRYFSPLMQ